MTAADIMQSQVACASPSWTIAELERAFIEERVSGFPVVRDGELVGVVSRSDVVRQLVVEHARVGGVSDYFRDPGVAGPEADRQSARAEAAAVTDRIRKERVADVMSPIAFVVAPDTPVAEVARLLVDKHIHRVPVVERGRLVGIVSSLDIVALVARGD